MLNKEQFAETIACGRPGTAMPFNLKGAYTQTACYGIPVGPAPAEVKGNGALSAEEIARLATFLVDNVVGKTRITRDNCAVFFDGNRNAPSCLQYN